MGDCFSVPDQPTTPISTVLTRIAKTLDKEKEEAAKYVAQLRLKWYYRAVDLLHVDQETLNKLGLSAVYMTKIQEYINQCRQNVLFTQFTEPETETNNMRDVLNALQSENSIDPVVDDIDKIDNICKSRYLYNIKKFKKHFNKKDFDELNVPIRLKIILSQRLHIKYCHYDHNNGYIYSDENELKMVANIFNESENKEADEQFDGITTIDDICVILSQKLLADDIKNIQQMLQPLVLQKYNRLYHLSTMHHNRYNELLKHVPPSITSTLRNMLEQISEQYNDESNKFMFYNYQKRKRTTISNQNERYNKEHKFELTMKTNDVFTLLEQDMNLLPNELSADCDVLMNQFYSNLWDWFFIPVEVWKMCPYYQAYEIVKIRIFDLMNLCQNTICARFFPVLPEKWLKKKNDQLSVKKLLYNKMNKEWCLDYNDTTKKKVEKIYEFMKLNDVNKINVISVDQIKNKNWDKFMSAPSAQIPNHLRFKISFYSAKTVERDDIWLNQYLQNYPQIPMPDNYNNANEEQKYKEGHNDNEINNYHQIEQPDHQTKVATNKQLQEPVNLYNPYGNMMPKQIPKKVNPKEQALYQQIANPYTASHQCHDCEKTYSKDEGQMYFGQFYCQTCYDEY